MIYNILYKLFCKNIRYKIIYKTVFICEDDIKKQNKIFKNFIKKIFKEYFDLNAFIF